MTISDRYQNIWERRSSIRSRPRKEIDFSKNGFFFPPDKQPLLLAPDVAILGDSIKKDILLYSLYRYLNDIIGLEVKLICNVCNKIIDNNLVVKFSDEVILNAYTIIIDEYYHVYIARDMLKQLNTKFPKLKKLNFPHSDAYDAVIKIKSKLKPKYRSIFEVIAVCIFETTLVRELVELFNDNTVHPSIKHYVNDHMNDESKHCGYFFNLLTYIWKNLPDDYQMQIGLNLVDFIKLYLNLVSDKTYNREILKLFLTDEKEINQILENIYGGFLISKDLPMVRNVLGILKKANIMDNKYVIDNFVKYNLYV